MNSTLNNGQETLNLTRQMLDLAEKELAKCKINAAATLEELNNTKEELIIAQSALEDIKANLNKYARKQIGCAPEMPSEERISKLLLYTLLEAYPRGLQIGAIAHQLNVATNSEHLTSPYHLLRAILEYYQRQGVVKFNGGQLYYLDSKMIFNLFG